MVDVIHLIKQCEYEGRMRWFSFSLFARPPLADSSRSACLNWSPAPGRGMCGRGERTAAAGGAETCLLTIMSCRSLAPARSLCRPPRHLPSSACSSLAGGWCDAWLCIPLASSVGGPPRFPLLRSAPLPAGRGGGRHIVCGELDETARNADDRMTAVLVLSSSRIRYRMIWSR